MANSGILWAASVGCVVGGALAGNALGSTPVADRSAIEMFYQLHETAHIDHQDEDVPPDHYPLVTRNGVVPVAQLSERGLFSQPRYRSSSVASDYVSATPGPGSVGSHTLEPDAELTESMAVEPNGVPPLPLAEGPAQVAGNARIIDVQATLALH